MKVRDIEVALCREIGRMIEEPAESLDTSFSLSELGMDSLRYGAIAAFIEREFGVSVTPDTLFELPSLRETAAHIAELLASSAASASPGAAPSSAQPSASPPPSGSPFPSAPAPTGGLYGERDIAIIGCALKLPGAGSLDAYWELLTSGACTIGDFPAEREPAAADGPPPGFLKGGFIDDADAFDAGFFGISPREAIAMDPQHRLFLECAWHAFEDAGYSTARLSGSSTAVFVGASSFDYYKLLSTSGAAHASHVGTGVSHAVIANRVSYYFNLKGASEAIDTACSSALVALCRAVDGLRKGDCDLALAGGVNLLASRFPFQAFAEAGMLNQEGVCRPFDDRAAGYVRGEGVGCVVLKRARDAVRDGDRILAVVKGGAVQHGGRTNSLTAPSPEAQAAVIVAAMHDAGVDPASVGYVEAHGTGTALGDPIEIRGLKKAFARLHADRGSAPPAAPHGLVGSVKAQIGHLEAAAGIAGLLKAIAALMHRTIPGSPHIAQINHHIDLSDAPFRFSPRNVAWEATQEDIVFAAPPRRACVSSFGFGGVNAHVVLEEAPPPPARAAAATEARLFLLSAKAQAPLGALCARLADDVGGRAFSDGAAEQAYLEDLAFTLRHARTPMAHRLAVVATTASELADKLRRYAREGADQADIIGGVAKADGHEASDLFDDEQELTARLCSFAVRGELRRLGRLWSQGLHVDWDRVLPRSGASLVELRGYPFARERFWVKPTSGEAKREVPQRSQPKLEGAAFYRAEWRPKPLAHAETTARDGAIIAIIAGDSGRSFAEAVALAWPERPLLFADCRGDEGTLDQHAADLAARAGRVGTILDVTPLDPRFYDYKRQVVRKLELLRRLSGDLLKRGEPIDLVQITRGLRAVSRSGHAPTSLAGAEDAGFFKALGAEYRRCRSKTIDFASADFDASDAARRVALEIEHHDGEAEVAYVDGTRLVPVMERVTLPAARDNGSARKGVALITGGTGDIGVSLARDLVARGFRALLLTGRKEPSPDKKATIAELERKGAAIEIYRGDLGEGPALREAIERVRAAHGSITHVFHCAGAVDRQTPAFFKKTPESLAAVMRPKVDALWVLHALLADDPPQAFVLFSSVSAAAPRLSVGLSDYAAANRFLDLFAEFQHANGRRYYRSIQWTRWRSMGLARGAHEAADAHALASEQCLDALHRLLGAGDDLGPTVCVLAEGDTSLLPAGATATRAAPPAPVTTAAPAAGVDLDAIRRKVRSIVASELEMAESKLDDDASFEEIGIDSIVVIGLISRLEAWIGRKLDPEALIRSGTLSGIVRLLAGIVPPEIPSAPEIATAPVPARVEAPSRRGQGPFQVAVIGIACRFPGAPDKETFWSNLIAGVDSITTIPTSRWDARSLYAPRYAPGRSISQWGGFIEGIEKVTPSLFGMNAEDAADIDPLVRLFTECSLDTVLDSPYDRAALRGRRVGVFTGARAARYAERIANPGKASVTGIGQNFIAAFVSHVLDLHGPSLVIDSACSSSLAAIHLACQSLQSGDSELALAGGVEVLLDEKPYLFLSSAHALSPDGRCRTFDEHANGFVPGEGVGCVLLKPLDQALADGDPIYAVIDGSAINNDGATLGITTPGVDGQVDVIVRALEKAGISPRDVTYVETHGTGTMIGDPIELRSLTRAFAKEPPTSCALGSVKTNIGHLLSAAGVASFIKVALSLHHGMLPPTLHCERVNPRFEFESTPFFPLREARPWDAPGRPRRAGISAFGFGKTNVHTIVSERPSTARRPVDHDRPRHAIPESEKIHAWRPARVTAQVAPTSSTATSPPVEARRITRIEEAPLPAPTGRSLLALEELTFEGP